MRRTFVSKFLRSTCTVGLLMFVSACSPPGKPLSKNDVSFSNQTGGKTADGKANTGAASDRVLEKLKEEIANGENGTPSFTAPTVETVSKIDRNLATRITSVSMGVIAPGIIRIQIAARDANRFVFDFSPNEIVGNTAKDEAGDVRYKAVTGKTPEGGAAGYEVSMLCRKAAAEAGKSAPDGCKTATLIFKEIRSEGAKAGIVLRSQETTVLAKSKFTDLKHAVLKRLLVDLKEPKLATLNSFEVAWGASRFSIGFGDSQVCPSGRLVETDELDEALNLNCAGTSAFRDLEGRMIGNTTRGEFFLELIASTPGLIYGETVEKIYVLVQQKRAPKKAAAPGTPATAPADDDDDDSEDESIFQTSKKPDAPALKLPATAGWLFPVSSNPTFAKVYAGDRKNPVIAARVEQVKKSAKFKNFASHFYPNKALVTQQLNANSVPPEFAIITAHESNFFITDGYPVQSPPNSSAWGMWQMVDDTASGNGLRIFPRLVNRRYVPGNICDERANLSRATYAAGRYIRTIMGMFPNDPKLVVLGYTMGEFGVKKKVSSIKISDDRMNAIKDIGLNFWAIRRFKMAQPHQIDYVINFVSYYHASLEAEPIASNVAPWKPNAKCN